MRIIDWLSPTLFALVLGAGLGTAQPGLAAPARDAAPAQITDPTWIVVNPVQPSIILAGTQGFGFGPYGTMFRSTDAGATWTPVATNILAFVRYRTINIEQPVISTDGRYLMSRLYYQGISPGGSSYVLAYSTDGGMHWSTSLTGEREGYRSGPLAVVTSPAAPSQAYALTIEDYLGNPEPFRVVGSQDGGQTWPPPGGGGTPYADYGVAEAALVPDPRLPRTVYAEPADYASPGAVRRSDDAGSTWTTIVTPTVSPAPTTFSVSTDPLLPGTLIGRTADRGIPADTRYFSTDSAHTWTAGTCPGDLGGICPTFTAGAAFGAGASYAFVKDGIYAFMGTGPAGERLAISDRLPVPLALIADVQAGTHPGDPIYLLTTGHRLYRSLDAGQSWRLLTIIQGPTPNLQPPSTSAGAVPVPVTHHSVAAPFVATYRRLGPTVIGYPVTEAYLEQGVLFQDFQHLRLRLGSYGSVLVAPLGRELFDYYTHQPGPTGDAYRQAAGTSPVAAVLLRFWQQHGGLSVFGAPISAVFPATNGDGSGRRYRMQYFVNARLEWHPEGQDPRSQVQVGVLGSESLIERGWVEQ